MKITKEEQLDLIRDLLISDAMKYDLRELIDGMVMELDFEETNQYERALVLIEEYLGIDGRGVIRPTEEEIADDDSLKGNGLCFHDVICDKWTNDCLKYNVLDYFEEFVKSEDSSKLTAYKTAMYEVIDGLITFINYLYNELKNMPKNVQSYGFTDEWKIEFEYK